MEGNSIGEELLDDATNGNVGTSSTLHYSRDEGGSYVCQVATVIGFIINSNASIQSTLLIGVRCDNLLVDNAIEEDDATVDTECHEVADEHEVVISSARPTGMPPPRRTQAINTRRSASHASYALSGTSVDRTLHAIQLSLGSGRIAAARHA
jgi:hypothetical protein